MNHLGFALLLLLSTLTSTSAQAPVATVTDTHAVDSTNADDEEQRGVDPRLFCHQYPQRCPVDAALVARLDAGDFNDLNVTYVFPTIPSQLLDHCTTIADRGERVKCVDDETIRYATRMQTPVINELHQMPRGWYERYQNYSTMPRLIVKQVTNADVVWRTCLKPNVQEVHAEQTFPIGW